MFGWLDRWLDRQIDDLGRAMHPHEANERDKAENLARIQAMSDIELKCYAMNPYHPDVWIALEERNNRYSEKWEKLK